MARRNDKRTRLVESADKLFHEQGVSTTTLANIAQLADVPLGNVYYYFKSKESIVLAVIEYRRRELQTRFEEFNTQPDVKSRLRSLIEMFVNKGEEMANHGDAFGSLCQELGKAGGHIAEASSELMKDILGWCEKQFTALGKTDKAHQLAVNLVSAIQGTCLLTLTFKDPQYIAKHSSYLNIWLDESV